MTIKTKININLQNRMGDYYLSFQKDLQNAFIDFLKNGQLIEGSLLKDFEDKMAKFMGGSYVIGCANGTASLSLALKSAGVKEGDEVITVANTYYATARSIIDISAVPVFCDIEKNSVNIDYKSIEKSITEKTKAIIAVHLYGVPAKIDKIIKIALKYNLALIEDCSHAFGSKIAGELIGSNSDYACFSLYPTKNFGGFGDGGMVVTKSNEVSKRIRNLTYFGKNGLTIFDAQAFHARLDTLNAALMIVMLNRFEEDNLKRKQIASIYLNKLGNKLDFLIKDLSNVTPYLMPFYVENRDTVYNKLLESGVPVSIRYKTNLHKLKGLSTNTKLTLPNAEFHNEHVLTLTILPALLEKDIHKICEVIKKIL